MRDNDDGEMRRGSGRMPPLWYDMLLVLLLLVVVLEVVGVVWMMSGGLDGF